MSKHEIVYVSGKDSRIGEIIEVDSSTGIKEKTGVNVYTFDGKLIAEMPFESEGDEQ